MYDYLNSLMVTAQRKFAEEIKAECGEVPDGFSDDGQYQL